MRADIKEAIVLAKALAFAAKATPARSTIPILTHAKLAVTGNQLEPALALIMPMSVPEWSREDAPPTKTEVHKFKAKPRAGAKEPAPEPEDAA